MKQTNIKPGVYYNVPDSEYRAWPCYCKSMMSYTMKSGKHLKAYVDGSGEDSDAMIFGRLVDCFLLEPDRYGDLFVIRPDMYPDNKGNMKPWSNNANYCRSWNAGQHKAIIKAETKATADRVSKAIGEHPQASEWLNACKSQVSIVWIDPETGITCKGRIDGLIENERLLDLKITNDPHPAAFSRTSYSFGYHIQGAFYHDGYILASGGTLGESPQYPFSFIACEDSEPFDCVCYNLGVESFDVGRVMYREALSRYKEIKESGEYYGYSNVAEELEIPLWAINRVLMEGRYD